MASDQGNNGDGSRDKESSSEVTAIADQVRILTEQVLASQQAQSAMQRTQEVMMEALKTLQQSLAVSHPLASTIPPSSSEDLNPTSTPQNLGRQGVTQTLLSQVNPTALNFTPIQTSSFYQTLVNLNQTSSPPKQRAPINPTLPTFPQTSPLPAPTTLTQSQDIQGQLPLFMLDQLKCYVRDLVQQESGVIPAGLDLDLHPPYPTAIAKMPYPDGYTVPKFVKFDGKRGNAREHVVRFIDSLGMHAQDNNLRLREFSKSLTHKAYTWYANLPLGSISSWDDLIKKFYAKFFYVDERLTTLHLMRETQKQGEDLLSYVRRFREKAIDIQDPLTEDQMVKMCIEGMHTTFKMHLVNHQFSDFSGLCLAARNLSETIKGSLRTFSTPPMPMSCSNHDVLRRGKTR